MVERTPRHPADALAFLAMVFPTVGALVYFVLLADSDHARWIYMASKVVQFAIPLVWVAILGVGRPRMGLRQPRASGLASGLVSGTVMGASILAFYAFFLAGTPTAAEAVRRISDTLRVFGVDRPLPYLGMALGLSLVHSLLEEYYWRWFVFQRAEAWMPRPWAAVLSSLAFAAHHLIIVRRYAPEGTLFSVVLPATAAVALGGVVWCALYRRHDSLLAPWISHVLVDLALMGMGYWMVFR